MAFALALFRDSSAPMSVLESKWVFHVAETLLYRQAVLQFMRDVNLTGLETDGQFEGIRLWNKGVCFLLI